MSIKKMLTAVFVIGAMTLTQAQGLSFGVFGGISQPYDEEANDWNMGFSVGGNSFLMLNPNLGVGLGVVYNRWSADEDTWLDIANVQGEVDGASNVTNIYPAVRYNTAFEFRPVNFFGEAGVGLQIQRSNVEIGNLDISPDDDNQFFGVLSAGVQIGNIDNITLDIFPSYQIAFPLDEAAGFFTVNAGVTFRFI